MDEESETIGSLDHTMMFDPQILLQGHLKAGGKIRIDTKNGSLVFAAEDHPRPT